MKFQDYPYERLALEKVKKTFFDLLDRFEAAEQGEEAMLLVREIQRVQNHIFTQANLVNIRHSLDTRDEFYKKEKAFWDENFPLIEEWFQAYYTSLLQSPHRPYLEEQVEETYFPLIEMQISTFDPKIIPLLQEENRLVTEYGSLLASAQLEYKGETYNLAGIGKFAQSTDREERKEVQELATRFYADHLDEFDRIYDDLVKVRNQMALELGFKDYVELGYARMTRLDYNREDVEKYRQDVLKYVVPVTENIYKRQAERIGLSDLKYYDLALAFKDGNATPKGDREELVEKARKMYHEMSPQTGEFIDFMIERNLLDLDTRPGKQAGGYCDYLADFASPFIFANFNGTSGDVDVLTHEIGHAFQIYESRWIQSPETIWPTYEACEIHSMSMEFFAWPWMESFFEEDVEKYKYSHLTGQMIFLPYGVLVDHFQHEVYENPTMTPAERHAKWRELEKQYLPWKDYEDNDLLEKGAYWIRQGHIYNVPFYYIDYTLAEVVALQFWKRLYVDHDEKAWDDYLAICKVGGSKSFLEIVDLANLESPFKPGFLKEVTASVQDYVDEHADQLT